jgi:hypothetical protein
VAAKLPQAQRHTLLMQTGLLQTPLLETLAAAAIHKL